MNENERIFNLLESQIDKNDKKFKMVCIIFTLLLVGSFYLSYYMYEKSKTACQVEILQNNDNSDGNTIKNGE